MAKTQINVQQLKSEAVKPFYAVAGATELAVAHARAYANEAQKGAQQRLKDVQKRVTKVERDPKALQGRAVTLVNARLDELQGQAKAAQTKFDARLKELQKDALDFPGRVEAQLNEALEELNATYADLAQRGEKFVAALRKDGVKAVAAVKSAPAKSSTRRSVIATEAANRPAGKSPASKSSARKSPAGTSPASKSTAKKAPAKGTAKSPAKRPAKSTATKTTAKKSTTTSTTTKASA
ncbi:MAG TPA: hypothetical protein VFO98_03750 [Marmoricola sp.]|nr:hypothetical protein [Marmoricola sp.]